jgi:DNA-binding NarL/FixJ family response regulator
VAASLIRVLIVEDYQPFRRFLRSTLQSRPELQVIAEVSDGLEAVQKAQELQPDLILLDIGLPKLNGIEVAKRTRKLSPKSKILFVSQELSLDVVQEALSTGASGYIVKTDAGTELVDAVDAAVRGEVFVSSRLARHDFSTAPTIRVHSSRRDNEFVLPLYKQKLPTIRRHEVGFYSDDECLLDHLTQFIGVALTAGNSAIVLATESHHEGILPRLQANGFDIVAAIKEDRYIALDAAEALSKLIVNGLPDPVRFIDLMGDLIVKAAKAAKREQGRVAIFGECVQLLWQQGNADAVIQFEKLGNQLVKRYDVDIRCAYSLSSFQGGVGSQVFAGICAEHSAVHSR